MILNPLLMLALYTFAFAGILKTRWPGAENMGGVGYAINLFSGLMIFNIFSEVMSRSPGVIVQNANLVKKVIFPLAIFSWVTIISACVQMIFSFLILLFALYFYQGYISISVIAFPVVLMAFLPFLLGMFWYLSSIGVYFRDLGQVVTLFVNLALFLSPIFYPASALPDYIRGLTFFNPLTLIIEQTRLVMISGVFPDWTGLLVYMCCSSIFAYTGFLWFQRTRKGFSDVL